MCDKYIKPQKKNKLFKSKFHKDYVKCKPITLTEENPNIDEVDSVFYSYITEHIKKLDYFLKKFKLIFNGYQYCPYITSELPDIITMCYWYEILENAINDFRNNGYNFYHKAEKYIITIDKKLDMSYDFYITHNM